MGCDFKVFLLEKCTLSFVLMNFSFTNSFIISKDLQRFKFRYTVHFQLEAKLSENEVLHFLALMGLKRFWIFFHKKVPVPNWTVNIFVLLSAL